MGSGEDVGSQLSSLDVASLSDEVQMDFAIRSYSNAEAFKLNGLVDDWRNFDGEGDPMGIESLGNSGFDGLDAVDLGAVDGMSKGEQKNVPEVFKDVHTLVLRGGGKMSVQLNPPHLGHIEIDVVIRGNKVAIEMTSENEAAKSILESQMGDLKRSLMDQDLVLAKAEVNLANTGQGLATDLGTNHNAFTRDSFESSDGHQDRSSSNLNSAPIQTVAHARDGLGQTRQFASEGRVDIRI